MQTRPDQSTLLDAVAQFLLTEVAPKLEADKATQFRVMIAANLANVVSQELRTHDARFTAEANRLAALLPGVADEAKLHSAIAAERDAALLSLDRELATRLRTGAMTPEAALEHLTATLADTLSTTNPRFDLSDEPH